MGNSAFSQNPFGSNSTIVDETPGGLINSSNTAFTTANNYVTGTLAVYQNGVRLEEGAGNDFTEGGTNAFTMLTAPTTGDKLVVDYTQSVTNRGNAYFSPPVTPHADYVDKSPVGTGFYDDNSDTDYMGLVALGTDNIQPILGTTNLTYSSWGRVSGTTPFTWATSDILTCSVSYEAE